MSYTPKLISQNGLRRYSDWYRIGSITYDTCCDCGLTHKNQFKVLVDHKTKISQIYVRTKRSVYKTAAQRKKRRVKASIKSTHLQVSEAVR